MDVLKGGSSVWLSDRGSYLDQCRKQLSIQIDGDGACTGVACWYSIPHAGFASRTELNLHSEQHCAGLLVRAISHPCFTGQRPLPSRAWVGHPWPSTALCFLEWPSMWQLRDSAQLPTATLAPFQRVSGFTWCWGSFAEAGGVRPTAAQVKLCWDRVGIKSQPEWVKLNQIDTFWNCAMLWVILDYLMVSLLVWGLVSHRIWESSLFVMDFGATLTFLARCFVQCNLYFRN